MAKIVVTQTNSTVVVGNGDTVVIDIPGGGTVTIKAQPGENIKNIKIEFKGDDHADTVKIDLATFSTNDMHIDIKDYDPSDTVALIGAFNRHVEPKQEDEYQFSYIGATGNTYNAFVRAKDKNEDDFNSDPSPIIICFAKGTIIDTELGPRPVESILAGDNVMTQANGPQPVRWIGRCQLDSIDLMRHPQLCPIRVRAGALGDGVPFTDLWLSPQHRLQVADWRAEYLFAESTVLVAVKHLVDGADIAIDADLPTVSYYHLLFDRHEILSANGTPVESLHPGDVALDAVETDSRTEILALFPDLPGQIMARRTANRVLKSFEAQAIRAYAS